MSKCWILVASATPVWGSFFSRKYGHAASEITVIPRRIWSKITIDIDPALAGAQVNAKILEEHTLKMLARKK